mmetsp:Transcript_43180/g.130495  ORF Transcript_43180/g.130495 Transcript_43180/m.130495 type:complete len:238 (-) Transcript_43180:929-1642(-)
MPVSTARARISWRRTRGRILPRGWRRIGPRSADAPSTIGRISTSTAIGPTRWTQVSRPPPNGLKDASGSSCDPRKPTVCPCSRPKMSSWNYSGSSMRTAMAFPFRKLRKRLFLRTRRNGWRCMTSSTQTSWSPAACTTWRSAATPWKKSARSTICQTRTAWRRWCCSGGRGRSGTCTCTRRRCTSGGRRSPSSCACTSRPRSSPWSRCTTSSPPSKPACSTRTGGLPPKSTPCWLCR